MLRRALLAILAGACLVWTSGQPSDPVLPSRDLPPDVAAACSLGTCVRGNSHVTRWIGRAERTDLFIVLREPCDAARCTVWLVGRSAEATATLLALSGEFRVEPAEDRYPAVQTRTVLDGTRVSYARYQWDGSRYVRIRTRLAHRVDGVECGSESECDAAAREALKRGHTNRAVRIWRQVHGVDWI